MTRPAGALLLTAAGTLCGLLAVRGLHSRYELCCELCQLLRLLSFQLTRFMTPLPELFETLSASLDGQVAHLCHTVARSLSAGRRFGDVWSGALGTLPDRERAILLPLGNVLGRYGPAEQTAAVTAALEDMTQLCHELDTRIKEKRPVYIGTCTAGGLMLAVLLL